MTLPPLSVCMFVGLSAHVSVSLVSYKPCASGRMLFFVQVFFKGLQLVVDCTTVQYGVYCIVCRASCNTTCVLDQGLLRGAVKSVSILSFGLLSGRWQNVQDGVEELFQGGLTNRAIVSSKLFCSIVLWIRNGGRVCLCGGRGGGRGELKIICNRFSKQKAVL